MTPPTCTAGQRLCALPWRKLPAVSEQSTHCHVDAAAGDGEGGPFLQRLWVVAGRRDRTVESDRTAVEIQGHQVPAPVGVDESVGFDPPIGVPAGAVGIREPDPLAPTAPLGEGQQDVRLHGGDGGPEFLLRGCGFRPDFLELDGERGQRVAGGH